MRWAQRGGPIALEPSQEVKILTAVELQQHIEKYAVRVVALASGGLTRTGYVLVVFEEDE